jgi:hypothetical protein
MKALLDNDVLLKGACYGLLTQLAAAIPGDGTVGVLGASKFVVTHYLKRYKLNSKKGIAEARLLTFLSSNEVVEPTPEEQDVAATLESTAQRLALALDVGESQLVAVLTVRLLPWFATGDKRAIVAIERLLDADTRLAHIVGKIICLEQLVKRLVTGDSGALRGAICSEPTVDKTLSICFGCASSEAALATILEGLESYIGALRADATRVLAI